MQEKQQPALHLAVTVLLFCGCLARVVVTLGKAAAVVILLTSAEKKPSSIITNLLITKSDLFKIYCCLCQTQQNLRMHTFFFIFSPPGCDVSTPLSLMLHILDLFILHCNIPELFLPFVTSSPTSCHHSRCPHTQISPFRVSLHFPSTSSQFLKLPCLLFR